MPQARCILIATTEPQARTHFITPDFNPANTNYDILISAAGTLHTYTHSCFFNGLKSIVTIYFDATHLAAIATTEPQARTHFITPDFNPANTNYDILISALGTLHTYTHSCFFNGLKSIVTIYFDATHLAAIATTEPQARTHFITPDFNPANTNYDILISAAGTMHTYTHSCFFNGLKSVVTICADATHLCCNCHYRAAGSKPFYNAGF